MKGTEILLGQTKGRPAAALLQDGVLEDFLVDSDAPRLGTIYRAKATRPVKGMGGMFLDTPDGSAFLRSAKGLAPGDTLLVQVSGYAEPGKAIPVTAKILFKSRFAIVTPGAPGINISRAIKDDEARVAIRDAVLGLEDALTEDGLILRSVCAEADANEIEDDAATMIAAAQAVLQDGGTGMETLLDGPDVPTLAWRDWPMAQPREADLDEYVAEALARDVRLPGGASMAVEPTRALVAVDVNSGADTSQAAGLKANIAALRALPRALRVRGLGGQIVVDPAPTSKKDRKTLDAALRAALRKDTIETNLVGWTPLGHIELSRKRDRPSLRETLK